MADEKNPENMLVMETSKGKVVIELMPDLAPGHVARIKELAREGAYDGVVFHRANRANRHEGGRANIPPARMHGAEPRRTISCMQREAKIRH